MVGPSLDILGGQSIQAKRMFDQLSQDPSLDLGFLAVNPPLAGLFGRLQKIKYVRTVVTSIAYLWSLLKTVPQYDVLHIFSASYWSFVLAPTPALIAGSIFRRP